MKEGIEKLMKEVIECGLCTGCGMCEGICPKGSIKMIYESKIADPIPQKVGDCDQCGICHKVCPGKYVPMRTIDKKVFGRECDQEKELLGILRRSLKGYAADEMVRTGSSSGGVVSALISYALDEGIMDGALLVGWNQEWPWRAKPILVQSSSEVWKSIRTVNEMVPVNALLSEAVRERGLKKIGIVGVPCHIHALRKLQLLGKPKDLMKSIKIMIGLYCATTHYYEGIYHLLREFGGIKELEDIVAMDYRGGPWPGSHMVMTRDGRMRHVATKHERAWHFLQSASYKRDRCMMCIDFSAENADISAGDIFQKVDSPVRELTGVLVRTQDGDQLVQGAADKKYIVISDHNPELIPSSGLGWESKKHAAMFRLIQRKRFGWPTPDFEYTPQIRYLDRRLTFPS